MQNKHRFRLLHFSLLIIFIIRNTSLSLKTDYDIDNPSAFCGKIQIQTPFLNSNPNPTESSSPLKLNHMILCRSQKLYFRTSIGLFPISSIDYKTKTLIISHFSHSSTHFVSPSLLSSGFPSPPQYTNSLLLFNCSKPRKSMPEFAQNCSRFRLSSGEDAPEGRTSSCIIVDEIGKQKQGFNPNDMNCSHYKRVYRNSSDDDIDFRNGYRLGTTISFDIPEQVPKLCGQCEKPGGHCGVGLRCLCHVLYCKDKVFSKGIIINPDGIILFSLFTFWVMIISPI